MMRRIQHRHIYLALGAWLCFALVLAACTGPAKTQESFAVGQTAEVDGWRITVHSFSLVEGDQWHQPADGHVFCTVELTLENASSRIRYVMAEKQVHLLDSANHALAIDREAGVMAARSRQWYPPQGEVGIGKALYGAASYEIPAYSEGLRWSFRGGLLPWSKIVVFVLGEIPAE